MPERKLPVGAEVSANGVHFRVWAPKRTRVEVVAIDAESPLYNQKVRTGTPLHPEGNGYFSGEVTSMAVNSRYAYALDGEGMYPDPASRFQPFGPHGASQVIAPDAFAWDLSETGRLGITLKGQVIYELHIGTFTPEGTYNSAIQKFQHLKDLGITVIEVMPIADFPGNFGWGYDGVDLFAPTRLYGTPDDFRNFVQTAHRAGLAVILDVVYNHLGPSGNYTGQFSDDYLTDKNLTDWGTAINFDGENSAPVREFYIANAAYWIREFHLDGLRLDATQAIHDESTPHILQDIQEAARAAARDQGRDIILVAENEDQNASLMSEYGIDGVWNDDLHHSAVVAMTGNRQAYYHDHLGHAQEFISAIKYGYLFQGQQYRWQRKRRGKSVLGTFPDRFISYLENHDQVANSGRGQRLSEIVSPGRLRAMTALMLLAPCTPMLFQGQEWASSRPFLYFADHEPELARQVRSGRHDFLGQFPALATPEMRRCLDDPESRKTFERCKLDWSEVEKHKQWMDFHHDLLRVRREDPAFRMQAYGKVDGAVLTHHAFVLRYFLPDGRDRLLVVNFGPDLILFHVPEPLLAPIFGCRWMLGWSTEDPKYGGCGMAHPDTENEYNWSIHADSVAVLLPDDCASAEDLDSRLWRVEPHENENDRQQEAQEQASAQIQIKSSKEDE